MEDSDNVDQDHTAELRSYAKLILKSTFADIPEADQYVDDMIKDNKKKIKEQMDFAKDAIASSNGLLL